MLYHVVISSQRSLAKYFIFHREIEELTFFLFAFQAVGENEYLQFILDDIFLQSVGLFSYSFPVWIMIALSPLKQLLIRFKSYNCMVIY